MHLAREKDRILIELLSAQSISRQWSVNERRSYFWKICHVTVRSVIKLKQLFEI